MFDVNDAMLPQAAHSVKAKPATPLPCQTTRARDFMRNVGSTRVTVRGNSRRVKYSTRAPVALIFLSATGSFFAVRQNERALPEYGLAHRALDLAGKACLEGGGAVGRSTARRMRSDNWSLAEDALALPNIVSPNRLCVLRV